MTYITEVGTILGTIMLVIILGLSFMQLREQKKRAKIEDNYLTLRQQDALHVSSLKVLPTTPTIAPETPSGIIPKVPTYPQS